MRPAITSRCWTSTRRFQSTHPVWDATGVLQFLLHAHVDFNPRIPYGMRPSLSNHSRCVSRISIHASRMGCDVACAVCSTVTFDFNPRIPYGMRREVLVLSMTSMLISIHASRMGCDHSSVLHPPTKWLFQSTHPVWDATCLAQPLRQQFRISIHASRMGCDANFGNSSSPCS